MTEMHYIFIFLFHLSSLHKLYKSYNITHHTFSLNIFFKGKIEVTFYVNYIILYMSILKIRKGHQTISSVFHFRNEPQEQRSTERLTKYHVISRSQSHISWKGGDADSGIWRAVRATSEMNI